jgi:hypothetical protein
LIICASGEAIHSAASLTYLTGICSGPLSNPIVDFSVHLGPPEKLLIVN